MSASPAIKAKIDAILSAYSKQIGTSPLTASLLPVSISAGKLYEAWVLCDILDRLHTLEHFTITLVNSTKLVMKTSGGPINPAYPHFSATADGREDLEVWTDIEFTTLSYARYPGYTPSDGDFHELDVVVVPSGVTGRPPHDAIRIGVECKNTGGYGKDLLRQALGVRRELSLLAREGATGFMRWPNATVPADPASCLLVYSTDESISKYDRVGDVFGIDFVPYAMA